jgi:fatty-acyl-CoA synthase
LAALDLAGYCSIVGRVKNMIIRGAETIYPRESEEYLFRHPAVLDIAVVGVPDGRYGEEVCACTRVREGAVVSAQEVCEFCHGHIAHYRIPRYVRFVEAFPLTATGKVQKYQLREAADK